MTLKSDGRRALLRHTVATVAYRGGKSHRSLCPVKGQDSVSHQDGSPADTNARDLAILAVDGDVNTAWALHQDALHAQDVARGFRRDDFVMQQIAAKRAAGSAGCRIFADAE